MEALTTFIISSIRRDTLKRSIDSVGDNPYLVGYDDNKHGQGLMKNKLINWAKTEWVSFLDDDDTVTSDYVDRLAEEATNNPEADVIHFREYFLRGFVIPAWPKIEWGNVGVSFSIKREVALAFPFKQEQYEDLELLKRLEISGKNIFFSQYLVYRARH